eukprot:31025_1
MCWSWEVSLAFALFEFIAFGYIFYRNQYIDRYYVLYLWPIALQEFFQFIVWRWGIDDNTTIHSCNNVNFVGSRIIVSVTFTIPFLFVIAVIKTIHTETKKWISLFWKPLLVVEICLLLLLLITELIDDEFCIFIGTHGHLDWIESIRSDLPDYITTVGWSITIAIYYVIPLASGAFLYQPQWIMFFPMLYIVLMFGFLRVFLGTECYSVWCWTGFVLVIWCLLYISFTNYLLAKYTINYIEKSNNCLIKFCFTGAHKHYQRFEMNKQYSQIELDRESELEIEPNLYYSL